jgi:hypothetical protein
LKWFIGGLLLEFVLAIGWCRRSDGWRLTAGD